MLIDYIGNNTYTQNVGYVNDTNEATIKKILKQSTGNFIGSDGVELINDVDYAYNPGTPDTKTGVGTATLSVVPGAQYFAPKPISINYIVRKDLADIVDNN
jgi:hypothetical protein